MLTLVCAALLLQPAAGPPAKTLLQQVIPNPSGRNAMEEYLIAAQVFRDPGYIAFERWENWRRTRGAESKSRADSETPKPPTPTGLSDDSTPLAVAREKVGRFGRALDIVAQGNLKPYFDPTLETGDALTLFPHLAAFRSLTRFGVEKAYVDFADGRSSAGFATLDSLLVMSANISHGNLISYLVSMANQAIVLAEIERNLHRASLNDAKRLRAMALGFEQRVATPQQVISAEVRFVKRSLNSMFDPTGGMLGHLAGEERENDPLQEALAKMNPAQRAAFVRLVEASLDRAQRSALAAFTAPEREWAVADAAVEETERPEPKTIDELPNWIAEEMLPTFTSWRRSVVTRRAQVRLLRLHADVLIYRWEQNRLPETLKQASGEAAIDPLTGEAYVFTPNVDGTFRIVSKGTPVTGEIALRMRRPPGADLGSRVREP